MSRRVSKDELEFLKGEYIDRYMPYTMCYWSEFNYDILKDVVVTHKKAGRGDNGSYNDIIIMCDTETSKEKENTTYYEMKCTTDSEGNQKVNKILKYNPVDNYIVAWTISLRCFSRNLATLYGTNPEEFVQCLEKLQKALPGDETFYYWHNLSYDYVFVRKFMFAKFGYPDKQLNTKPHFPIMIKWTSAGITFKDSLVLAQRRLEKWAEDLNVPHQKAVGKWDYSQIRSQRGWFKRGEMDYIENDTLAGVECIDYTMRSLNKHIYSMPYTATGIPREELRNIAKKNNGRRDFLAMVMSYEQYIQAERCYHGGYTHANRYQIDKLILGVICRDFSSSYPFCMLSEKYVCEGFQDYHNCDMDEILEQSEDYEFMFKLIMIHPRLKDPHNPMPALQYSKCSIEGTSCINPIVDNGRILEADYVEIYLNAIDLSVIKEQYKCDRHICTNVYVARKDYLPRWFTDYVYKLYSDKCTLKNGDPVLYAIAKAKLNSLYGVCVQKCLKENYMEDFKTGEYKIEPPLNKDQEPMTPEEQYQKYVDNKNSFLNYFWGVEVTSYAMRNLFELSKCCIDEHGTSNFVYSDTDSIYAKWWDEDKVKAYNDKCLAKLLSNGYKPVQFEGETYTPGAAEFDGAYSEFKVMGAKRYCCRYSEDPRNKEKNWGKLKITVAGVPKNGVDCLHDDINEFKEDFVFPGTETGKLTHHYIINDDIKTVNGNIYGDSVDLTPCDYLLSKVEYVSIDDMITEEIEVQVYE